MKMKNVREIFDLEAGESVEPSSYGVGGWMERWFRIVRLVEHLSKVRVSLKPALKYHEIDII